MDHASWSAYSQHLSRLGASMNPSSGSLSQAAQLNDLSLPSAIPRQDHLGGYGNAAGPHHFLLATPHGLNPSQTANRGDHSFGSSGLFVANYDASLLSASFQPSNKGHISTFPQGPGFFKAVGRDNDFNDLRTGFSHCGMSAYGRNPEGNGSHPGSAPLGSNALFPNSMPSGTWRPSGIMPSSCGPFGVLPHETVLQRSHLGRRGSDKQQSSKGSRTPHPSAAFMEQDLSRSYRGILSSPARPPSSFMEHSNPNHSSLLSPQNDPYFSSVTDSYYNSCSKTDFAAYSSYCSNMPSVQRGAISPYCYPQSFSAVDASEKQEHNAAPNAVIGNANSNFSNVVPNSSFNRNPNHPQNGFIPRQTVIATNNNNSAGMNSPMPEGHSRHSYGQRDAYNCSGPGPTHSSPNMVGVSGSNRPAVAHSVSSHQSFAGQTHYPPMSTPIPAATPAHPTPPSTMGQAHVPALIAMNHDSGCSVVYNSPSNDGCYSTSGTCHSGSASPSKHDMSQHSSPSIYSMENSNLSMNNSPFVDPNRMHQRPCIENQGPTILNNVGPSDPQSSTNDSMSKVTVNNLSTESSLLSSGHNPRTKEEVPPLMSLKINKLESYSEIQGAPAYENHAMNPNVNLNNSSPYKQHESVMSHPEALQEQKGGVFMFSGESTTPALDYTQKNKHKFERDKKDDSLSAEFSCQESEAASKSLQPSSKEKADENHASPETIVSVVTPESKYVANDIALPVDLSQVSSNSSSKEQKASEQETGTPQKCDIDSESNYEHSMLSSTWSISEANNQSSQLPVQKQQESDEKIPVTSDEHKPEEELCTTSSMDDMSNESKNKLVNNIEEDLGFLAELSAASDVDDTASKESFADKKGKKQQGFFQSFLTFLESSNEPTSTSEAITQESGKSNSSLKASTLEISGVMNKGSGSESHWILDKDPKKAVGGSPAKSDDEHKISTLSIHEDKDNFEEAPSLDSGLFSCNNLQKEMVVPNPEAPSFSSDEDENSAQGIFDSVAMAIQRLCDDNEDDNREKSDPGVVAKTQPDEEKSKAQKSTDALDEDTCNTLIDETLQRQDGTEKTTEPTVPSLIVKQRRGRRKRGRHLLFIKVNRIKKQNAAVPPTTKVASKPKKKLPTMQRVRAPEAPVENTVGRRSLMRKCKQKRFQRNCETKRKRKARLLMKGKQDVDSSPKEEIIISDSGESTTTVKVPPPTAKRKLIPSDMNPTVKIAIVSSLANLESIPSKVQKFSKGRQRRRRRHRQHKKPRLIDSSTSLSKTDASADVGSTTVIPGENPIVSKIPESTNTDANGCGAEVHFKTGDYVTLADGKEAEQFPVWRIEGKNVLQLFEIFEEKDCAVLYRNTTSYSRWSPSSKHKYSKLIVNVVKCDDESVIIEMPKKTEKSENKQLFGVFSLENYAAHPQRENFEVYLQTLVSHALDPDFIPEIVKENDEYFLSHLQAIDKIMNEKKQCLLSGMNLDEQFQNSAEMFPHISVSMSKEMENKNCRLCQCSNGQYIVHFHGQLYDLITLEHAEEARGHSVCDWQYSLCSSCVHTVTLYSRLHHHKYHLYQLGCKRVKDVIKEEKDSHAILEDCLQDAKWMSQMFQDMMELWSACDKFR